ncbi:MAG: hypothetical protein FJ098_07685, partial [Deltaproteobacteria bacterium]|nr:hypothetical protein [Deltaproteobacteria bacterium]
MHRTAWILLLAVLAPACVESADPLALKASSLERELTPVTVDREFLRDGYGRYLTVQGINISGTSKLPVTPAPGEDPRGTPVSFVGRP